MGKKKRNNQPGQHKHELTKNNQDNKESQEKPSTSQQPVPNPKAVQLEKVFQNQSADKQSNTLQPRNKSKSHEKIVPGQQANRQSLGSQQSPPDETLTKSEILKERNASKPKQQHDFSQSIQQLQQFSQSERHSAPQGPQKQQLWQAERQNKESTNSDETKLPTRQKRRRGKPQNQKEEQVLHTAVIPTKESSREHKPEQKAQPVTKNVGKKTESNNQIKECNETSLSNLIVPLRKKLGSGGTIGKKIIIETNHLGLKFKKINPAIHYDVCIEPDKPKKLMRVVMEQFRIKHYPNRFPAFDGSRNLYSSSRLPFGDEISGEIKVQGDGRDIRYKVKVKFANEVDLSCLEQYFESAARGNVHMATPQEAIQCIDIVLRNSPSLHCIPAGRSFFVKPDIRQMINLGEGMEMYHGFFQSAVLGWKPYLNVDVSHKAFPKAQSVLDLVKELTRYYKLEDPLINKNFEVVNGYMKYLKVQYMIPNQPSTKRVLQVNQLDKPANRNTFKNHNNVEMTVSEYFEKVKGVRLKYPHLPCLWVGSKQREPRMQLPMEFCEIIGGQVTNRAMTPKQTSAMIQKTATPTNERKLKIMSSIKQANYGKDRCAQEFGISVGEEFTKIKARVLPPPAIKYYNRQVTVNKGCWRADKFCKPGNLDDWSIVCLNDGTSLPELELFANMMIQQGGPLGMNILKPQIVKKQLKRGEEKQIIEQVFQKLKSSQLILVVLPDPKEIYSYVKQVAELRVGVITQCVTNKNFSITVSLKKLTTVGNILLKINTKLNGINHVLSSTPSCFKVPCMVMGADVTHPGPGGGSIPSVAAVTASHDSSAFNYNITCRLQNPTQEIITDLAEIVREHIIYFQKKNSVKPHRIIFFRDGVSEGQFETVVDLEVQAVKRACKLIDRSGLYEPKLTFLVVQKRHHTRFFPTNPNDSEDRNNNVPAGTVVDTDITHPTALDFYLVSHASIKGVARPTKYRKLWDENDMQEDELEELTYHLCHMYARCTRSVSYPAPTYYAHLAAARAKVYCEKQNINMNNLEGEQHRLLNIKPEVLKDTPMYFV